MCPSRGRFYVLTWGLLINVGLTAPNLKLEEVHPNQLLDFLSAELNIHDQKSPEALYHLNEFQDVSENWCCFKMMCFIFVRRVQVPSG